MNNKLDVELYESEIKHGRFMHNKLDMECYA
jgi:hypothetical protein